MGFRSNLRIALFLLLAAAAMLSCSTKDPSSASIDDKKVRPVSKGLHGKVVDKGGKPVKGTVIQALLGEAAEKRAAGAAEDAVGGDSVMTDSAGSFHFDGLAAGTYNLQGDYEKGTLVVLIRSIKYAGGDTAQVVPTDTLRAPGQIAGRAVSPTGESGGIICYVPGTSYLALTDDSGAFVLSGIPQGTYSLSYRREALKTAKDTGIEVASGRKTTLADKILQADPAFPPPAPSHLSVVEYDTLSGRLALNWVRVIVSDLSGYVLFKNRKADANPDRLTPTLITDTTYTDTLFRTGADSGDTVVIYRLKSQDSDANISTVFSKALIIRAVPPSRVLTTVALSLAAGSGLEAEIGDTVRVVSTYVNPTRRIKSISWRLDSAGTAVRVKTVEALSGSDTLSVTSAQAGDKLVRVSVADEKGATRTVTLRLHFHQASVVLNPSGGSFYFETEVRIRASSHGALIFYSLDGSVPDSNSIRYDSTKAIRIVSTRSLKAVSYRPGKGQSLLAQAEYRKIPLTSTLEIAALSGSQFPGGFIPGNASGFTISVSTSQAGLDSIRLTLTTVNGMDRESIVLPGNAGKNTNSVFTGNVAFKTSTSAVADKEVNGSLYDTLVATWANPFDSSDAVIKKIPIRPALKQAQAYFSPLPDGSTQTDQYAGTETAMYLFVVDQVLPPGANPKATLATTPSVGVGRTKDTEILDLIETATPGLYRAAIVVDQNPTSNSGDGKLQLALNDVITATFKDPLDSETDVVAIAGYGIAPEIVASLQFTDKTGNIVPSGAYYSPAEGALYLQLKDDWVNGTIIVKTVSVTIVNNGGKAPGDQETFTVPLNIAKKIGSTGIWEGSLKLADGPAVTKVNGTAETYVFGQVHAAVTSHNKIGAASIVVSDDLGVAYPNQNSQISVEGSKGPGFPVSRIDSTLKIAIKDQSLSTVKDTLYFTLSCTASKDVLVNLMAVETSPEVYESPLVRKAESAVNSDNVLQCNSLDMVRVTYVDPVYGVPKAIDVPIDNPKSTRLYFSDQENGSREISSANGLSGSVFYAVVEARGPNLELRDTVLVTLTTPQGEVETLRVEETSATSETFILAVPYVFITGAVTANNGKLEAKFAANGGSNLVTVTATVTIEGNKTVGSIGLQPAIE